MPSELQQNRYDQLLRRVGGMVGPGSKVSEALSELFPVIEVEDTPSELKLLAGTALCFGAVGVISPVGEQPKAQLFNPDNSGMLLTITRIDVTCGANSIMRYGIEGASRGAFVASASFADSRLGIDQRTTGQVFFQSSVGESLHTGRLRMIAAVNITMRSDKGLFVLAPGTGLTLNGETTNQNLDVSFMWRERVAEQSELNF